MSSVVRTVTEVHLRQLAEAAWDVWERAYVLGKTKVGAAVMASDGSIFTGCNVEQRLRSHDVHAEVNAITSMVAAGLTDLVAIVIAAERRRLTPCGGCMDWIYQFGGPECVVGYQSRRAGEILTLRAHDIMPYYPM